MSISDSLEKITQDVNQMCFQVGQLMIQNEINEGQIKDITSRAISLAKKAESLKQNMPKQGAKDEPKQEIELNGVSEQPGEVGTA